MSVVPSVLVLLVLCNTGMVSLSLFPLFFRTVVASWSVLRLWWLISGPHLPVPGSVFGLVQLQPQNMHPHLTYGVAY